MNSMFSMEGAWQLPQSRAGKERKFRENGIVDDGAIHPDEEVGDYEENDEHRQLVRVSLRADPALGIA
jgi:hypothetical protein